MNEKLLSYLQPITEEERAILEGRTTIDRELYMQGKSNTISSQKLLGAGKLITVRTHTRFIDFPEHCHDYVEVVYMCSGETTHFVNGRQILLKQGELLFLSQSALHAVRRAEKSDIAVNFVVLPDFFTTTLSAIGEEETSLRRFLVDCLCGSQTGAGYLHFQVANVTPVQNLVENLLWTLIFETPNRRKISQMTMALLFLQLVNASETLVSNGLETDVVLKVLRYVETNYVSCSLSEIAATLHYDLSWLSREIKRQTGNTFTEIVQKKRMAQAAFLLRNTDTNVSEISVAVGYENVSYFHRLFSSFYGQSPRHYRNGS